MLNKTETVHRSVPRTSRKIFKGYYEDDIEVAIQKIEFSPDLFKEIQREFQILRQLDNHENFIRYYSYETDEKNDFVQVSLTLFKSVASRNYLWVLFLFIDILQLNYAYAR